MHTAKWHQVFLCTNNARIYTNTFQKISGFKASSAQHQACFSRTLLYETLLFVSLLVSTEHLFPWQPHLLFHLWLTAGQRGRGPAEDTPPVSHCSPWRRNTMWFSTNTGVRIILFTFECIHLQCNWMFTAVCNFNNLKLLKILSLKGQFTQK